MSNPSQPIMGNGAVTGAPTLVTFTRQMSTLFCYNEGPDPINVYFDSLANTPYLLQNAGSFLNLEDVQFYRVYFSSAGTGAINYAAYAPQE